MAGNQIIRTEIVWDKIYCKICRKRGLKLSRQGLCPNCSIRKQSNVIKSLRAKKGYWHMRWKRGLKKALKKM